MAVRVLIACRLAFWFGCGKQPASTPPAAEPTAGNTARPADPSAAVTGTNSSAEAPDDAQMAAVLGELTQVVRKYSVERRRVPRNLGELVANGYLTRVPQAPTRKKFAISKELPGQLGKK